MRKRGVENMDLVMVDPWLVEFSYNYFDRNFLEFGCVSVLALMSETFL